VARGGGPGRAWAVASSGTRMLVAAEEGRAVVSGGMQTRVAAEEGWVAVAAVPRHELR
jgi:hypothetical protein